MGISFLTAQTTALNYGTGVTSVKNIAKKTITCWVDVGGLDASEPFMTLAELAAVAGGQENWYLGLQKKSGLTQSFLAFWSTGNLTR